MTDPKDAKDGKKEGSGVFGLRKAAPPAKKGRYVTVKEEKRRLKRVVKAKPMSRKHMADALKAEKVTEEEIKITEKVIEKIAAPVVPRPSTAARRTFPCFQCGAQVPYDADKCPRCRSSYLRDLREEDVEELMRAEEMNEAPLDDIIERASSPVVHFDTETGVMHFLEEDNGDPDFAFECTHCGTVVELNTDRCPICGTHMDLGDTGLVGMFADMDFDPTSLEEADCPFCGDHVHLDSGKCPTCSGVLSEDDLQGPSGKIRPVLRADNVVFLHLDILTGEINFLQKSASRARYEQTSVQLDGIGNNGFDQDWSSLSRI